MQHDDTGVTRISREPIHLLDEVKKRCPTLQIIRGWNVGHFFTLDIGDQPAIIGRDKEATFRIQHDSVSRNHAIVSLKNSRLYLKDNSSTNGTSVNGRRISEECLLTPGDKIYIGDILLRFDFMDAADIDFHRQQREKIQSAQRDPLTNLLSKGYFLAEVPKLVEYCLRKDLRLCLIMIDLDFFKRINDTYGHPAGDHVLQKASAIIVKGIRENDVAIRFGGEEIMLLLQDISVDIAEQVAQRLRQDIEHGQFCWEQQAIPVTISLGLSALQQGDSVQSLLDRSDRALYASKRGGRNRLTLG